MMLYRVFWWDGNPIIAIECHTSPMAIEAYWRRFEIPQCRLAILEDEKTTRLGIVVNESRQGLIMDEGTSLS